MPFKVFRFGNLTIKQIISVTEELNKFELEKDILKTEVASNANDGALMFVTYREKTPAPKTKDSKKAE